MLPKNLAYGSKVESASARSYRTNIQPQNGTGVYNAGDTIIINIPTRNNLVYVPCESYLKFKFEITASAETKYSRFDSCGAHGLIQRIRVFHGSNLLSDIDNYGLLSKLLFDLQNVSDDEVLDNLEKYVGYKQLNNSIYLNWHLTYTDLQSKE